MSRNNDGVGAFTTTEALFMIDEYDGTIIQPTVSRKMKKRIESGLSEIMETLKGSSMSIISGVYHPHCLGFLSCLNNNYYHFSKYLDPNKLAFTKKEVQQNYKHEI